MHPVEEVRVHAHIGLLLRIERQAQVGAALVLALTLGLAQALLARPVDERPEQLQPLLRHRPLGASLLLRLEDQAGFARVVQELHLALVGEGQLVAGRLPGLAGLCLDRRQRLELVDARGRLLHVLVGQHALHVVGALPVLTRHQVLGVQLLGAQDAQVQRRLAAQVAVEVAARGLHRTELARLAGST